MQAGMSVDPALFQAVALASGLRLYAKTGMRPNRMWTPSAMIAKAREITGNKKLKARDYVGAADALKAWADAHAEKMHKAGTPPVVIHTS